jgi:hypothetical protein
MARSPIGCEGDCECSYFVLLESSAFKLTGVHGQSWLELKKSAGGVEAATDRPKAASELKQYPALIG